jgi:RNA polymerase sigma factor (sigma-70 family)
MELNSKWKGRRSEYEVTRDRHIRENMWKASHAARKVAMFSGLPFDELRSVALEAMVKLYDKWDPSRANFSTWLNRSLTFQVLNYLRDHSRMIKMPRLYADTYMKIRKITGANPDISDEEVAEQTGLDVCLVSETRKAYQVTYQEINEDTEMPFEDEELDKDSLARMFEDYDETLKRLADLPEKDYEFLIDVYIHKRAYSTIARKNPGICNSEKIRQRTEEIMGKVILDEEVIWLPDM